MAVQTISKDDVKTNRHEYIGGSDIAVIMGMSRWKTPLKLWAEKTQKLPMPDLSNVEAVQLGVELEQFVADKFAAMTGKAVRRSPKVYQHKEFPYMVAHIDRLVTGTDELLECKTCSFFKKDEWDGEDIPQEYILQVMWYLGITGRKVGYIAVLIGGQSFKYKRIEFDQELFETMVDAAKEFWACVKNDTPPAIVADDDETLKELWYEHSEKYIELYPTDERTTEAVNAHEEKIAYLQELKAHIKSLQDEQKEIEAHLKDLIKDNEGIESPKYIVTWKMQKSSRFDSKLFKQEHPELAEQYTIETTSRVLRITNNKKMEVA
jgi:putative phage-type endonuclease